MAVLQLYSDSIDDYPVVCQNLTDLGFTLIPKLPESWKHVADILVLVVIGSFLTLAAFGVLYTPQLAVRRWMILLGLLYLTRGVAVILTRYPRSPYQTEKYEPANFVIGAFSIMLGLESTATDFMYSGHTVNFILAAEFVSRYTNYGWFSVLFWVVSVFGIVVLIGVGEHYLSDIYMAFVIVKLGFWCYHQFFDSWYKRYWVTGFEVVNTGPGRLSFPLRDKRGRTIMAKNVPTATNSGLGRWFVDLDPCKTRRGNLYRVFKHFDAE